MSDSNREHLSSLIDGELDRKGRRFLLRRIAGDDELRGSWRRLHLVRACLQRENLAASDLTERIARALASEPAPGRARSAWLRPVAGSAIAASVALVAIVGINSSMLERQQEPVESSQPGFVSQPTPLDEPFTRSAVPVSYSESEATAERDRISGHVLRHHQASGSAGFVSFVPIITGPGESELRDRQSVIAEPDEAPRATAED